MTPVENHHPVKATSSESANSLTRHRLLTRSLAQGPSVALGYIKRNINNAETMTLEACFDGEAIHHTRAGETTDHKEAAKAFVEKRKPTFQGQ